MGIHDLPPEIIQFISENYLIRGDQSKLSKTSKQLRLVVEPTLYQRIRWLWEKYVWVHPPVHLLVRTLLNRPDLASCVKEIELRGRKSDLGWRMCPETRQSATQLYFKREEITALQTLIVSSHFASEELWLDALESGDVDLFIAILLMQSSKIRRLVLESDFCESMPFFTHVLQRASASTPQHPFSSLKSVTLCDDIVIDQGIARRTVSSDQILPLFQLRAIETLSLSIPSINIAWRSAEAPKSSITSLSLTHSQLSEKDLGKLLSATPGLKSLTYQSHYGFGLGGHHKRNIYAWFHCSELDKSLLFVKDTLETLKLSLHFGPLNPGAILGDFRGMTGRVKALSEFNKLKCCEIPIRMVFGWEYDALLTMTDLMPPKLEELCLTDDLYNLGRDEWTDKNLLQKFEDYLRQRGKARPRLNRMEVLVRISQTAWWERDCQKLEQIGISNQVNCSVSKVMSEVGFKRPQKKPELTPAEELAFRKVVAELAR